MVNIRHYQSSDRDGLIALWRAVFPDDPPHNDPVKVIDEKSKVDNLIFVAENPGYSHRGSGEAVAGETELIGACMAGYDGHRGWLYAVAVSADCRRERVGQRLVNHAVDRLRELGCVKVNLQIRADNTDVAKFYQSLGFDVEQRMSMGKLL